MTANALWPSRPDEKWQHRLSSRTPTGTEPASRQLIRVHKNKVKSNMRRNQQEQSKDPDQGKDLDISDLLIERAFAVTHLPRDPKMKRDECFPRLSTIEIISH
jgi:phage protein D